MSRIKSALFACLVTALLRIRDLAKTPTTLRRFRQNLAASTAPAAVGAMLILVLVGLTPALSQPPAPDPLEVVEETVSLIEPYLAPAAPPLPRPSDAELAALSNNAAMKGDLLHECVLALAVAGPLGTPCSAPASSGPASSSTNYWPESPQGTTPFGGGPLKSAFNCPYAQDSSVNIVTGEFVGRTCVFAANAHLGPPFSLILTYRSQASSETVLGHQWDHNFNKYLTFPDNSTVELHSGQGRTHEYKNGTIPGTYTPPHGVFNNLTKTATGFRLVNPHGSTEVYNETGRLLSSGAAIGNDYTLSYNADGLLSTVTDAHGRSYTFAYDSLDRLASMTSFDSRTVEFEYDSTGNLVKVFTPGPTTGTEFESEFAYESGHLLANATDNKGQKYLFNEYDAQIRVEEQTYGTGVHRFGYKPSASLTNVTDPNGNNRTYHYESFARPITWHLVEYSNRDIEPSDPDTYHTYFLHDLDFQRTAIRYPEGNVALFVFDDENPDFRQRGNLIASIAERSVTNPVGQATRMVLYTYEPLYNLIKTVTDARGLNPDYVPQNLGPTSPTRYTTTFYYDYEEGMGVLPSCQASVAVTGVGSVPPPLPPLPGPSVPANLICTLAHAPLGDINGDGKVNQTWGNRVRMDAPRTNPFGNPNPHMLASSAFQDSVTTIAYNDNGQITSITHPEANVDLFTYDTSNFLQCMTQDAGSGIDNHTDEPYRNLETCYTYDTAGNLLTYEDPTGHTWTREYDKRNRITQDFQPSPASGKTAYIYDENDNQVESRVYATASTYYSHTKEYNILDTLVANTRNATRPSGIASSQPTELREEYYYDANGNLVLTRHPEATIGNDPLDVTSFIFDERNLLHAQSRGGVSAKFSALAAHAGVPVAGIVAPGNISTAVFTYDGNTRPVTATGPRGGTTTNVYDGLDQLVQIIDALGNERRIFYDARGEIVQSRSFGPIAGQGDDPSLLPKVLLGEADWLYDERGRVYEYSILGIDPATGKVAGIEGNLTPDDARASQVTDFDRAGRPIRLTDDNSNSKVQIFDGVSQLFSLQDALGNALTYTYDERGNPLTVTSTERKPGGGIQTYQADYDYNELGQMTSLTDPFGNSQSWEYGRDSNIVKHTDERGNTVGFLRDAIGRAWRTTYDLRSGGTGAGSIEDTVTTDYEWDADSRLVKVVDDNGNPTNYTYDSHGRLSKAEYADSSVWSYMYDADGNLLEWADPNGNKVSNSYDLLSRLVERNVSRGPGVVGTTHQSVEYNGLSQPTQLTDNNNPSDTTDDNQLTAFYDTRGQVISGTFNGLPLVRSFDGVGNVQSLTYYNGRTVARTFDEAARTKQIIDPGFGALPDAVLASYSYTGPDKISQISFQNGINRSFTFDALARVEEISDVSGPLGVFDLVYTYDAASNTGTRSMAPHPEDDQIYQYDSMSRLEEVERGTLNTAGTTIVTPATSGLSSQTWDLDGANNWLSSTTTTGGTSTTESRTFSSTNEVSTRTIGGVASSVTHDDNGNVIDDGSHAYEYDFANRLVNVKDSSSSTVIAEYKYDIFGRRTEKRLPAHGESYLYAGGQLIEVRDNATGLTKMQYVYGPGGYVMVMDQDLNGNGVANDPLDSRLLYHLDLQGNVIGVSNSTGVLVEGYTYTPYGERTIYEPGPNGVVDFGGDDVVGAGPSNLGNDLGFLGQVRDNETGLYYLNARYYDPSLGTFLTRDPIGVWADPFSLGNGYAYAGNNPSTRSDPSGLSPTMSDVPHWTPKREALGYTTASELPCDSGGNAGALTCIVSCPSARPVYAVASPAPGAGVILPCGDSKAQCHGLVVITIGGCHGGPSQPGCSGGAVLAAGGPGARGACTGGDGLPGSGADGGYGCNGVLVIAAGACTGGTGGKGCNGANGAQEGYTTGHWESNGKSQQWEEEYHERPGPGQRGCDGGAGGAGCQGGVSIDIEGCSGGMGGEGGKGGDGASCNSRRADGCDGGDGGRGGDGGTGGVGCDNTLSVSLGTGGGCKGGQGGKGGDGGNGGNGGDGDPNAPPPDHTGRNTAQAVAGLGCGLLGPGSLGCTLIWYGATQASNYIDEEERKAHNSGDGGDGGRGGDGGTGGRGCTGLHVGFRKSCAPGGGGAPGEGGDRGVPGSGGGDFGDKGEKGNPGKPGPRCGGAPRCVFIPFP